MPAFCFVLPSCTVTITVEFLSGVPWQPGSSSLRAQACGACALGRLGIRAGPSRALGPEALHIPTLRLLFSADCR